MERSNGHFEGQTSRVQLIVLLKLNILQEALVTPFFWWIVGIYPFIPILLSVCLASVYQRFSPLSFRQGLAVEAGSSLSLYLLILLCGVTYLYRPVDNTIVVATLLVLAVLVRLILLRHYLSSMLNTLINGIFVRKNSVLPIIPLIFSMGLIVVWIISSKVQQVSSTIVGGGRTLRDVELFSSHLSDLFNSTSHVYLGIVPTILISYLLLTVFWYAVFYKKSEKTDDEAQLIRLFYLVVVFCCYVLALGVAFGKSSLYILFYHYFPFFNYPRVSDRIMVMVLFAGAIAVAFSVKNVQRHCTKPVAHVLVISLLLIAMGMQLKDYNVFKPMGITLLDRGQDIYTHVKENIGDGLLLEIPLWPGDSHQSSLYQHYIMIDRVKRVNGYSPLVLNEYIETVVAPLSSINAGMLNRQQYEMLRKLKVKFVTVHDHENVFPKKVSAYGPITTVRRMVQSPYLEFVNIENFMHFKTFDWRNKDIYLFKVKENVPAEVDKEGTAWYDMPYFYGVHSRLHQLTGKVTEDKTIGKQVFQAIEGENQPGFLVYGPYDVYSSGEYRCYFTINTDASTEEDIARIEVASVTENGDQVVLVQTGLKGEKGNKLYRKVFLEFSLAEKAKLEFRVFYYGKGDVRVEQVAVYKANNDAPLYSLEAVKMVGDTGQLMLEKEASAGKVIEAIVGKSKKGDLVYGPNRIYSKGHYRARFYLRTKKTINFNKTDVAAVLSVTDEQNATIFSQRNVPVMELDDTIFTGVEVEFELTRDEELSFHVEFTGKASLQLDRIEIVRR